MNRVTHTPWRRRLAAGCSRAQRSRVLRLCGLCAFALLAGCSGSSELAADLRPDAIASVRAVAGSTGLSLSEIDAGCAADALGTEQATELVDQGDAVAPVLVASVLGEVIECVGPEMIARSAIAPQAPGAGEESIECAADRFDEDLLVTLLAGSGSGAPDGDDLEVRLELELATVLASCLSPEELLDLGQ